MKQSTVLVIEDSRTNRKLFKTLLERAGYAVLEAEEAKSGIALAREQRPDLILMDIQLPGMDGFTATRIIKGDPEIREIPVVALTALAMLADQRKTAEAGCDGYISKPIETREFADTIREFLSAGHKDAGKAVAARPEYRSRILIVDDEILNVKLLSAQLSSDRHEIRTAYSGAEALEEVATRRPDVILLDVMMPGMDGFEVARRLKGDPATSTIPILMVTALDERENRDKALAAGADDFLRKPVNPEELRARINSMLCLKHCSDGLAAREQCEKALKTGSAPRPAAADGTAPAILLIEDNDRDARLIGSHLEGSSYRLLRARDGKEARALVSREEIDLILLDILLPDTSGIEVCRRLKEDHKTANIQVVVITCLEDMESKVRCLDLGADEYLLKPVEPRELRARLKTLIRKKRAMDQLRYRYRSALDSALIDPVTGTYNQIYFRHFLDLEVKRSRRYDYPMALLLLELEEADKIERDRGLEVRDGILKELTQVLTRGFRETDLLARYHGNGFGVVLQYLDKECAIGIAERLRLSVADHRFVAAPGLAAGEIRISMGMAFCPTDASSVEGMIERAQAQLHAARNRGEGAGPAGSRHPAETPEDLTRDRTF